MKKIAFCFLTYKNLNQPKLWKHFFINNNEYNIYIHNKEDFNDEFSKSVNLFKHCCILGPARS